TTRWNSSEMGGAASREIISIDCTRLRPERSELLMRAMVSANWSLNAFNRLACRRLTQTLGRNQPSVPKTAATRCAPETKNANAPMITAADTWRMRNSPTVNRTLARASSVWSAAAKVRPDTDASRRLASSWVTWTDAEIG